VPGFGFFPARLILPLDQAAARQKGRYPSGQRGQTVNLLAYAYAGSNPALPTTFADDQIGRVPEERSAVLSRLATNETATNYHARMNPVMPLFGTTHAERVRVD
jgi:hypothetical protein